MKNQLEDILIFGMTKSPTKINLNGEDLSKDKWTFYTNTTVLNMTTLNLDLSKSHNFVFL
jgi:hypothetical protein